LADVDPFVIQWPNKWLSDPEIRPVIEYLNRFLHDLFIRTGGGGDLIEEAVDNSTDRSDAARISGQISRLEKRLEEVENRDFDALNAKIARLNRLVESLLQDLITEVKKLRDVELENKAICVQEAIRDELKLLNARSEEAFETHIDGDDLE